MADPLVTPDDLGLNLNDATINVERALLLIEQSQQACETVASPLPDAAAWIVMRVAARAYVSTTTARGAQQLAAGSPMGGATPGALGGVWLSRTDIRDLRMSVNRGGAFSIDMLPAGYALSLPYWDSGAVPVEGYYWDGSLL